MRNLLPLLLVAAACGCANRPPHTTQAPPVVARNEAQAGANTPSGANSPSGAADQAVNDQDLLKQGYKPVTMRGELHYCRKETLTGSRFSSQVCLTLEQIKALQSQAREDLNIKPMGCGEVGMCK